MVAVEIGPGMGGVVAHEAKTAKYKSFAQQGRQLFPAKKIRQFIYAKRKRYYRGKRASHLYLHGKRENKDIAGAGAEKHVQHSRIYMQAKLRIYYIVSQQRYGNDYIYAGA
jgi:hypothetical protein